MLVKYLCLLIATGISLEPLREIRISWNGATLYFGQAAVLLWTGDRPGAVIMLGYIIANGGLIWALS